MFVGGGKEGREGLSSHPPRGGGTADPKIKAVHGLLGGPLGEFAMPAIHVSFWFLKKEKRTFRHRAKF